MAAANDTPLRSTDTAWIRRIPARVNPEGGTVIRTTVAVLSLALATGLAAGCTGKTKLGERELKAPVNCATAERDIKILQDEKDSVAERVVIGATSVTPAGAVLGILTMTEEDKLEVAVGEYNHQLDAKIAEIKRECGV